MVTSRSAERPMSWSWVTRTRVSPSPCSSRSSSITWAAVSESRLPVGSSAHTTSGRPARARATVTRCCSPPDSSVGRWLSRCPRPTRSRVCWAACRASLGEAPASSRGSSTFSMALKTGIRLKAWNTKPMAWARCLVRRASLMEVMSSPLTITDPASMSSRPDRQFNSVVLPEPDGPITATNSPRSTTRSTPRNASTVSAPVR